MSIPSSGLGLFRNNNNSCFLNSCLQLLFSCPDLFRGQISQDSLIKEIYTLFRNIDEAPNDEKVILSTASIRRQLPSHFSSGQQDAQECIGTVIDLLNRATKRNYNNYSKKELGISDSILGSDIWENFLKNNFSLVTLFFSGQFRTESKCLACKTKRFNYDPFGGLDLDIPESSKESVNLESLILNFLKPETLSENVDCEKCKARTRHSRQFSVWRWPQYLLCQFKVFKFSENGYQRNRKAIHIPRVFQVSNPRGHHLNYSLLSTINHNGSSPYSGHYFASVLREDKVATISDTSLRLSNKLSPSSVYVALFRAQYE